MEREKVYALCSDRLLLLDTSPLSPQCSLETSQFGTILLKGQRYNGRMICPCVLSLSILCKTVDGKFKIIPVFPDNNHDNNTAGSENENAELTLFPTPDPPMEVSTVLKLMRGLREILKGYIQAKRIVFKQQPIDSVDNSMRPLQIFLHVSEQIFHFLLAKMRDRAPFSKNAPFVITSPLHGDTALLQEVELNNWNFSWQGGSNDVDKKTNQITLRYEDPASRVHQMVATLSPCHSMILFCQLDIPESALKNFPVAFQTMRCEYENREHTRGDPFISNVYNSRAPSACKKSSTPSPFAKSLTLLDQRSNDDKSPSTNSTEAELSTCYEEFKNIVVKLQDLWNELEHLDRTCCIIGPVFSLNTPTPRCLSYRIIQMTTSVSIAISLDIYHPRKPPADYQFISTTNDKDVYTFENRFRKKIGDSEWHNAASVRDNLERCLGISLPWPCSTKRPDNKRKHQHDQNPEADAISNIKDCGVCYTFELRGEETEGSRDQTETPSIICENQSCGRIYHESCLQEWLESLSSSRMTFDIIIGECPYCNEPISAPMRGVEGHRRQRSFGSSVNVV